MRILSQDGLHEGIIDVPYEQVSIEQRKNEIWCGYSSTMDNHCTGKLFAKYSTEAKARKAMEMLIEECTGISHERRINDLYGKLKYGGKEDIRLLVESLMIKGKYFRFPADNEIEV